MCVGEVRVLWCVCVCAGSEGALGVCAGSEGALGVCAGSEGSLGACVCWE